MRAATSLGVWIIAAALLLPAFHAAAQQTDPASQSEIAALDKGAAQLRDLADQASRRAADWDALAKAASDTAAKTSDPVIRKSWEDGAREHAKRAKEQRNEAARLTAEADEKAAQARQREAALTLKPTLDEPTQPAGAGPSKPPPPSSSPTASGEPAPTSSSSSRKRRLELASVLGVWRLRGSGEPLVIEQMYPAADKANQYKLVARTTNQDYTGEFVPGDNPTPSRLRFSTRPKAEFINKDIPDWVRQKVEGKLQWDLQLDEPACGCPTLEGQWYPGEVTWDTDTKNGKAEVTGRGNPVKVVYEHDKHITLAMLTNAGVRVILDEPNQPSVTVDSLWKLRRFSVEVWLPGEAAKQQGSTLDVSFTVPETGATAKVQLNRMGGGAHPFAIRYINPGQLTFANLGDEPSRESALGPLPALHIGERIPISVPNGAEVVVEPMNLPAALGHPKQSVRVYDSWIFAGIGAQKEAMDKLALAFSAVLSAKGATQAQRADAHNRIRLLNNGRAFLASENLAGRIRYDVGSYYIGTVPGQGFVFRPNLTWLGALKPHPNYSNVVWAATEESAEVTQLIATRREALSDDVIPKAAGTLAYGFYQGFWHGTSGGNLVISLFGIDDKLNEVSTWERVKSGALVLVEVLPIALEVTGSLRATFSAEAGAGRITQVGTLVSETVEVGEDAARALPARLRPTQGSAAVAAEAAVFDSVPGARPSVVYPPYTRAAPNFAPLTDFNPNATPTYFGGVAGQVQAVDIDFTRHLQFFDNSCQLMSTLHLVWEATNKSVTELAGVLRLEQLGLWTRKIAEGIRDEALLQVLNDVVLGIRARSSSASLTIYEMAELVKDGYWLKNVVRSPSGGLHAIALKRFISDASGVIRTVEFFDPWVGKVVSMDVCDFESILSPASMWPNTQAFQFL